MLKKQVRVCLAFSLRCELRIHKIDGWIVCDATRGRYAMDQALALLAINNLLGAFADEWD
jgi:hypothetical protein